MLQYSSFYKDKVYQPSEDTYLLLDCIDDNFCNKYFSDDIVFVEVGSGSGILSATIGKSLSKSSCLISLDINCFATKATLDTYNLNKKNIECVFQVATADGLLCLRQKTVDFIIFNSPYLESEDLNKIDIVDRAWAGGENGTVVITKILIEAVDTLKKNGCILLLLEERNAPNEYLAKFSELYEYKLIKTKKIPGECLKVFLLTLKA